MLQQEFPAIISIAVILVFFFLGFWQDLRRARALRNQNARPRIVSRTGFTTTAGFSQSPEENTD